MYERNHDERGFVLVTTLVVLMILTIMLVGLYMRGKVNVDTSISERDATQAFYLAEAGLNYLTWALYMDPNNPSKDNKVSLDGDNLPDNTELAQSSDQAGNLPWSHTLGYFDVTNAINFNPATPKTEDLAKLVSTPMGTSGGLPPHVALDITITQPGNKVSVTPEPWGTGAAAGAALPSGNGAVVWLVAAVYDPTDTKPLSEVDTTNTSNNYAVYAYSIGFVNGKPLKMLRGKLGWAWNGFPANLGAMTNGYQ